MFNSIDSLCYSGAGLRQPDELLEKIDKAQFVRSYPLPKKFTVDQVIKYVYALDSVTNGAAAKLAPAKGGRIMAMVQDFEIARAHLSPSDRQRVDNAIVAITALADGSAWKRGKHPKREIPYSEAGKYWEKTPWTSTLTRTEALRRAAMRKYGTVDDYPVLGRHFFKLAPGAELSTPMKKTPVGGKRAATITPVVARPVGFRARKTREVSSRRLDNVHLTSVLAEGRTLTPTERAQLGAARQKAMTPSQREIYEEYWAIPRKERENLRDDIYKLFVRVEKNFRARKSLPVEPVKEKKKKAKRVKESKKMGAPILYLKIRETAFPHTGIPLTPKQLEELGLLRWRELTQKEKEFVNWYWETAEGKMANAKKMAMPSEIIRKYVEVERKYRKRLEKNKK